MIENKHCEGVVTVEATISLTAFMFAIVTLLTVVNICTAQAKIAIAIDTTANEISQYSYFYSLTGFNKTQAIKYKEASGNVECVDTLVSSVNSVFDNAQSLGKSADEFKNDVKSENPDDVSAITKGWKDAVTNVKDMKDSAVSIKTSIQNIAKNPKDVMFGMVELAANDVFDLAKSRLIAAPLSKEMCKKHLVDTKNGDCEAYLKHLGVVPGASGKYIDGLDFTNSSLFPNGSDQIEINVRYKIKVIALLPIDITYDFNQTAITHGWLSGEESTGYTEKLVNKKSPTGDTLWNSATSEERNAFIRNQGIKNYCDKGYSKVAKSTYFQLYNKSTNDLAMVTSYNPLESDNGKRQKTLNDISEEAVKLRISNLAAGMSSSADGSSSVTLKNSDSKETYVFKSKPSKTVYLVIPEDEGLKEKIEGIIKKSETNGVKFVVQASYGTGVSKK